MSEVITKMITLVLLMFVGYFCSKVKITGPEFNKHASKVMMDVLLSATIIQSVLNVRPTVSNSEVFYIIALFFLMLFISWGFGLATAKLLRIPRHQEGVSVCLVTYMNTAFVGFPIVEALYGAEAVFYASLSGIPFNLLLYSAGVLTLQGGASEKKIAVRDVVTVPLVVTILATGMFLFRIPLPEVVEETISTLAGGTIPISMIIIGTSLGAVPAKEAFTDWRVYIISLVRLIICPLVIYFLMSAIVNNEMIVGILTILAATPSGMVLTVLCIQHGQDDGLASKGIFISTVFSAVTIPFIIWLLL